MTPSCVAGTDDRRRTGAPRAPRARSLPAIRRLPVPGAPWSWPPRSALAGLLASTSDHPAAASAHDHDTPRPLRPGATPADQWVLRGHRAPSSKLGSVHIDGKITQGKSRDPPRSARERRRRGRRRLRPGRQPHQDRAGRHRSSTSTRRRSSGPATPRAAQTKAYGGKWIEISALDARFTSFDQFLDAADLVAAAFEGHTTPLTVSRPTTFARPQGRDRQGHGHHQRQEEHRAHVHRRRPARPTSTRSSTTRRAKSSTLVFQPLRQGGPLHRPAERHQPDLTAPST